MDPQLEAALDKVIAARERYDEAKQQLNQAMVELLNLAAKKAQEQTN